MRHVVEALDDELSILVSAACQGSGFNAQLAEFGEWLIEQLKRDEPDHAIMSDGQDRFARPGPDLRGDGRKKRTYPPLKIV